MEQIVTPGRFTQIQYSGDGLWMQSPYPDLYDPIQTGSFFAEADDDDVIADYDVGMFTGVIDMSGETSVTLEFDRNFQDFAGYGYAEVNTYSGGTDSSNLEENLWSKTTDDSPTTGIHTTLTFDPSAYADPSQVYIEFYYTDDGYGSAWKFAVDEIVVTGSSGVLFHEGFETDPFGGLTWIFTSVYDMTGEIVDPAPSAIVSVIGKMKANDLAYYRHAETAMETMVILALNLEDGMENDGSIDDCLGAYWSEDFQGAHNIGNSANAKGHGYGYWSQSGGYGYFLNPGRNGNGMAGFSGNEAVD
jgi:hypothetical protein